MKQVQTLTHMDDLASIGAVYSGTGGGRDCHRIDQSFDYHVVEGPLRVEEDRVGCNVYIYEYIIVK